MPCECWEGGGKGGVKAGTVTTETKKRKDLKQQGKDKENTSHSTVPEESSKLVSDVSFSFSNKLVWLKSLCVLLSSKCSPARGTTICKK